MLSPSAGLRFRIRPMTAQDLKQVVGIEAACFGREAWPRQAFTDLLRAFAQARPSRGGLWVAEDRDTGEILAYAGIEESALKGEADIINIAVAERYRRRRIGRELLEWIVRHCRRRGIEMLWLRVRASNVPAQRFYRAVGFQECGCFNGYYLDPAEPAILMAMDL